MDKGHLVLVPSTLLQHTEGLGFKPGPADTHRPGLCHNDPTSSISPNSFILQHPALGALIQRICASSESRTLIPTDPSRTSLDPPIPCNPCPLLLSFVHILLESYLMYCPGNFLFIALVPGPLGLPRILHGPQVPQPRPRWSGKSPWLQLSYQGPQTPSLHRLRSSVPLDHQPPCSLTIPLQVKCAKVLPASWPVLSLLPEHLLLTLKF